MNLDDLLDIQFGQAPQTQKELQTTFVIPIIRDDYIVRCLETLYQCTDKDLFRVIVIDQTPTGVYDKINLYTHLYIRPYRNLGFAKAMNTGICLASTPYVSCFNDDVEFLNPKWWDGIMGTFAQLKDSAFGVQPMSPKEAAWGYGGKAPEGRVLTEDKRGVLFTHEGKTIDLDYAKTEEGYDLLQKKIRGWIDGVTTWGTTFKTELFDKIGLFEEKFYPGGGEDYDLNARAYDPDYGGGRYRIVATSNSWVYHHWGSSGSPTTSASNKEALQKQGIIFDEKLRWNNWTSLWQNAGHHPTVSKGRLGEVTVVDL